jgi:hypothetical protein
LERYARAARDAFPSASQEEREKIRAALEMLASFEGIALETALKDHRELLEQIRRHRQ